MCLCAYIERDKCRYIDTNMYVCIYIHTFANAHPRVVPGTRGGGSATPRGAVPEVSRLECMVRVRVRVSVRGEGEGEGC